MDGEGRDEVESKREETSAPSLASLERKEPLDTASRPGSAMLLGERLLLEGFAATLWN